MESDGDGRAEVPSRGEGDFEELAEQALLATGSRRFASHEARKAQGELAKVLGLTAAGAAVREREKRKPRPRGPLEPLERSGSLRTTSLAFSESGGATETPKYQDLSVRMRVAGGESTWRRASEGKGAESAPLLEPRLPSGGARLEEGSLRLSARRKWGLESAERGFGEHGGQGAFLTGDHERHRTRLERVLAAFGQAHAEVWEERYEAHGGVASVPALPRSMAGLLDPERARGDPLGADVARQAAVGLARETEALDGAWAAGVGAVEAEKAEKAERRPSTSSSSASSGSSGSDITGPGVSVPALPVPRSGGEAEGLVREWVVHASSDRESERVLAANGPLRASIQRAVRRMCAASGLARAQLQTTRQELGGVVEDVRRLSPALAGALEVGLRSIEQAMERGLEATARGVQTCGSAYAALEAGAAAQQRLAEGASSAQARAADALRAQLASAVRAWSREMAETRTALQKSDERARELERGMQALGSALEVGEGVQDLAARVADARDAERRIQTLENRVAQLEADLRAAADKVARAEQRIADADARRAAREHEAARVQRLLDTERAGAERVDMDMEDFDVADSASVLAIGMRRRKAALLVKQARTARALALTAMARGSEAKGSLGWMAAQRPLRVPCVRFRALLPPRAAGARRRPMLWVQWCARAALVSYGAWVRTQTALQPAGTQGARPRWPCYVWAWFAGRALNVQPADAVVLLASRWGADPEAGAACDADRWAFLDGVREWARREAEGRVHLGLLDETWGSEGVDVVLQCLAPVWHRMGPTVSQSSRADAPDVIEHMTAEDPLGGPLRGPGAASWDWDWDALKGASFSTSSSSSSPSSSTTAASSLSGRHGGASSSLASIDAWLASMPESAPDRATGARPPLCPARVVWMGRVAADALVRESLLGPYLAAYARQDREDLEADVTARIAGIAQSAAGRLPPQRALDPSRSVVARLEGVGGHEALAALLGRHKHSSSTATSTSSSSPSSSSPSSSSPSSTSSLPATEAECVDAAAVALVALGALRTLLDRRDDRIARAVASAASGTNLLPRMDDEEEEELEEDREAEADVDAEGGGDGKEEEGKEEEGDGQADGAVVKGREGDHREGDGSDVNEGVWMVGGAAADRVRRATESSSLLPPLPPPPAATKAVVGASDASGLMNIPGEELWWREGLPPPFTRASEWTRADLCALAARAWSESSRSVHPVRALTLPAQLQRLQPLVWTGEGVEKVSEAGESPEAEEQGDLGLFAPTTRLDVQRVARGVELVQEVAVTALLRAVTGPGTALDSALLETGQLLWKSLRGEAESDDAAPLASPVESEAERSDRLAWSASLRAGLLAAVDVQGWVLALSVSAPETSLVDVAASFCDAFTDGMLGGGRVHLPAAFRALERRNCLRLRVRASPEVVRAERRDPAATSFPPVVVSPSETGETALQVSLSLTTSPEQRAPTPRAADALDRRQARVHALFSAHMVALRSDMGMWMGLPPRTGLFRTRSGRSLRASASSPTSPSSPASPAFAAPGSPTSGSRGGSGATGVSNALVKWAAQTLQRARDAATPLPATLPAGLGQAWQAARVALERVGSSASCDAQVVAMREWMDAVRAALRAVQSAQDPGEPVVRWPAMATHELDAMCAFLASDPVSSARMGAALGRFLDPSTVPPHSLTRLAALDAVALQYMRSLPPSNGTSTPAVAPVSLPLARRAEDDVPWWRPSLRALRRAGRVGAALRIQTWCRRWMSTDAGVPVSMRWMCDAGYDPRTGRARATAVRRLLSSWRAAWATDRLAYRLSAPEDSAPPPAAQAAAESALILSRVSSIAAACPAWPTAPPPQRNFSSEQVLSALGLHIAGASADPTATTATAAASSSVPGVSAAALSDKLNDAAPRPGQARRASLASTGLSAPASDPSSSAAALLAGGEDEAPLVEDELQRSAFALLRAVKRRQALPGGHAPAHALLAAELVDLAAGDVSLAGELAHVLFTAPSSLTAVRAINAVVAGRGELVAAPLLPTEVVRLVTREPACTSIALASLQDADESPAAGTSIVFALADAISRAAVASSAACARLYAALSQQPGAISRVLPADVSLAIAAGAAHPALASRRSLSQGPANAIRAVPLFARATAPPVALIARECGVSTSVAAAWIRDHSSPPASPSPLLFSSLLPLSAVATSPLAALWAVRCASSLLVHMLRSEALEDALESAAAPTPSSTTPASAEAANPPNVPILAIFWKASLRARMLEDVRRCSVRAQAAYKESSSRPLADAWSAVDHAVQAADRTPSRQTIHAAILAWRSFRLSGAAWLLSDV